GVTAAVVWIIFSTAGCLNEGPRVTGSGVFEATTVTISPEIAGRIEAIPVEEGDAVAAGDPVCRLDTALMAREKISQETGFAEIDAHEAQAAADAARASASLEGARREYERARLLLDRGSISRQQYDEIETAYSVAQRTVTVARSAIETIRTRRRRLEAALDVLEYKISLGTIASPLTGTVLETYVDAGEYVVPGRSLMDIADLQSMWIRIFVPEPDLAQIVIGNRAKVYLDGAGGKPVMGTVSWIADTAQFTPKNVQTRSARADLVYAVKITVDQPDDRLKIGMPADVCLEGFPEYEHHPYPESR
ncbi:MAG TPA: efflux RND transporter periplasmic adaptor subunit, partial [bacterium]|nr:efflux RND transporter periplasmic adaptor subunit [bacterium]